jgi:hypothetical protein
MRIGGRKVNAGARQGFSDRMALTGNALISFLAFRLIVQIVACERMRR